MDGITHLTFDCYGTLIDWERGILDAVLPVLVKHGVAADPVTVLREFVELEAREEQPPFKTYREVLLHVMRGIGERHGVAFDARGCEALPGSVGNWPAFPDSVAALAQLARRYRLVVVSNIDDELFAGSARRLGNPFAEVVTAKQVRSYKPGLAHFHEAMRRTGADASRILHVAQSLWHDHVPAQSLGMKTAWVERPSRLGAIGLAPPADVKPHLHVASLQALADEIAA
jgi:2-haloacid dehalogenase